MRVAWIAEPPFGFARDEGVSGCDVELARVVAGKLGDIVEPVETTFPELLDGLAQDRWDMTVAMFVTAERESRACFTMPIWSLRDGLLIRSRDAREISGYGDLASLNAPVAVLCGQAQVDTAIRLGIGKERLLMYRDYRDAAAAVAAGKAIAYASVALAHHAHIAAHPEAGFSCVLVPEDERRGEPGAFACRDANVRDRVNSVLSGFIGSPDHLALLAASGVSPASLGF